MSKIDEAVDLLVESKVPSWAQIIKLVKDIVMKTADKKTRYAIKDVLYGTDEFHPTGTEGDLADALDNIMDEPPRDRRLGPIGRGAYGGMDTFLDALYDSVTEVQEKARDYFGGWDPTMQLRGEAPEERQLNFKDADNINLRAELQKIMK